MSCEHSAVIGDTGQLMTIRYDRAMGAEGSDKDGQDGIPWRGP
jgi:hypothetical protein